MSILSCHHGTKALLFSKCLKHNNQRVKFFLLQQKCYLSGGSGEEIKSSFIREFFTDQTFTVIFEDIYNTLHSTGVPVPLSILGVALSIRLATFPLFVFSEKLLARRYSLQIDVKKEVFKKISNLYNVPILEVSLPSSNCRDVVLNTTDKFLLSATRKTVVDRCKIRFSEERLTIPRIFLLKLSTIPIWIFSSHALICLLANFANSGKPEEFLWSTNILAHDPFYIFPVFVGVISLIYFLERRSAMNIILSLTGAREGIFKKLYFNLGLPLVAVFSTYYCTQLPIANSYYWTFVMSTALIQSIALRHPRIRSFLGVGPFLTDTSSPIKDLLRQIKFLKRK